MAIKFPPNALAPLSPTTGLTLMSACGNLNVHVARSRRALKMSYFGLSLEKTLNIPQPHISTVYGHWKMC